MDYDRNIHHNPDAMAWAKFFVVSTKDMGREVFCDEGYMVGWFANAMMAMHDSMKPHEAADEIERLREDLDLTQKIARIEIDAKIRYAWALSEITKLKPDEEFGAMPIETAQRIARDALKQKD